MGVYPAEAFKPKQGLPLACLCEVWIRHSGFTYSNTAAWALQFLMGKKKVAEN